MSAGHIEPQPDFFIGKFRSAGTIAEAVSVISGLVNTEGLSMRDPLGMRTWASLVQAWVLSAGVRQSESTLMEIF